MGLQRAPKPVPPELDRIGKDIVDAAFKVHTTLGPGLLESVYETCLEHELKARGYCVSRQVHLPVIYDSIRLESALRLDMVVNEVVIVEVKAVETVIPVHKAQILTYLKLTGLRLGYLINFNEVYIRDGISRLVL